VLKVFPSFILKLGFIFFWIHAINSPEAKYFLFICKLSGDNVLMYCHDSHISRVTKD
jgi:hypothetical protein